MVVSVDLVVVLVFVFAITSPLGVRRIQQPPPQVLDGVPKRVPIEACQALADLLKTHPQ